MPENFYWLGFSVFPGIGPARFKKLLEKFETAQNAWKASEKNLQEVLEKKLVESFLDFREKFSLEKYVKEVEEKKIWPLYIKDPSYPLLLKQIPNPPFVLYVKGNVSLVSNADQSIAIVGTRKPTNYGQDVTQNLTQDLVAAGFVIVSGLAVGVDAVAHTTTLEEKGKTIAVLGCGVDCPTPSQNALLYDRIQNNSGAIVSETAFGLATAKGVFPARNRIIAGLSLGVVVTEGAADSGALITADYARKIQRPIFAVPGPITSALSQGPNNLLVKGALPITSAQNIISKLGYYANNVPSARAVGRIHISVSSDEQHILTLLENGSLHFDQIVNKIEKGASVVGTLLSLMEIKGLVRKREGKYSL